MPHTPDRKYGIQLDHETNRLYAGPLTTDRNDLTTDKEDITDIVVEPRRRLHLPGLQRRPPSRYTGRNHLPNRSRQDRPTRPTDRHAHRHPPRQHDRRLPTRRPRGRRHRRRPITAQLS